MELIGEWQLGDCDGVTTHSLSIEDFEVTDLSFFVDPDTDARCDVDTALAVGFVGCTLDGSWETCTVEIGDDYATVGSKTSSGNWHYQIRLDPEGNLTGQLGDACASVSVTPLG